MEPGDPGIFQGPPGYDELFLYPPNYDEATMGKLPAYDEVMKDQQLSNRGQPADNENGSHV